MYHVEVTVEPDGPVHLVGDWFTLVCMNFGTAAREVGDVFVDRTYPATRQKPS